MLILLDCRPLQDAGAHNERSRVIFSAVNWLSVHRQVKWLFLLDKQSQEDMGAVMAAQEGARLEIRGLPGNLGWKYWYDVQIPRVARKYKADMVMTTGGRAAGKMAIPQCCWLPYGIEGKRLRALCKGLDRAASVFCFSAEDKDRLLRLQTGAPAADNIRIIHPASGTSIAPVSGEEKQEAKDLYAEGREYFLADITGEPLSDVVHLLKAFSVFKKRQRSNMKFLLAGTGAGLDKKLSASLENYKFRQDVHWVSCLTAGELDRVINGAYAVVECPRAENIGLAVLDLWRRGVPVVNRGRISLQGAGDALLQVEKDDDPAQLAEHLKLLYKDEGARSRLIEKGRSHAVYFNPEPAGRRTMVGNFRN